MEIKTTPINGRPELRVDDAAARRELTQGSQPLELRLRQIHHRRRRAAMRRLVTAAFWGAGILAVGAFALALGLEAAQR